MVGSRLRRGIRSAAAPALLVVAAACAVAASVRGSSGGGGSVPAGPFQKLVFSDEFDELDVTRWQHEITAGGGGNWEFQWYTNNRSNSYVEDGVLYLKPTLTADNIGAANLAGNDFRLDLWGGQPADQCTGNGFYGCTRVAGAGGNIINPIQSARVRTANSFSFRYGHVQIRAKLPRGDWIWPALWLLPRHNAYGGWPASGEIDIMESRGNEHHPQGGVNQVGSTLHMGPYWAENGWPKNHGEHKLPSGTFADDFHVFGLVWTAQELYTYVDDPDKGRSMHIRFDQSFWTQNGWDKTTYDNPWKGRPHAAPFDQEFFLVMNVAVGGTAPYFADGVGGKPWTNADPHCVNAFWAARDQWLPTWKGDAVAMAIDYVRVYQ